MENDSRNFIPDIKLDIKMIKEDKNFADIDDEKASLLIDTIYSYSVILFNSYIKKIAA